MGSFREVEALESDIIPDSFFDFGDALSRSKLLDSACDVGFCGETRLTDSLVTAMFEFDNERNGNF
jgi:hypothetical protein